MLLGWPFAIHQCTPIAEHIVWLIICTVGRVNSRAMLIQTQIMGYVKPGWVTVLQWSGVSLATAEPCCQWLCPVMTGQWIDPQVVDAKRRTELVEEELAKRKSSREDMRAQLEREAEAGLKLQLQQKDLEWRQKYQVMLHVLNGPLSVHRINRSKSHGIGILIPVQICELNDLLSASTQTYAL